MPSILSRISTSKAIVLLSCSAVFLYILKTLWKYKSAIQTLIQIKSTLSNAKNMLDGGNQMSEVLFERIQRKFTTWSKLKLKECDNCLAQLRNQSLPPSSKEEIWKSLSLSVFTELLTNLYSSEIFKLIFMISTHLFSRKEQEGENTSIMIESVDQLNTSISTDHIITNFIQERINSIISSIPLRSTLNQNDLIELFDKIKMSLNTVKRIPMPVYEFSVKIFPEWLKNDPGLKEMITIYCLPEIQFELKERIDEMFQKIETELCDDIEKNGYNDSKTNKGIVIDFPKLIPLIRKKEPFCTWKDYGKLARLIYFDLYNYI